MKIQKGRDDYLLRINSAGASATIRFSDLSDRKKDMRTVLLFIMIALAVSCDRDEATSKTGTLIGKWKLTAQNISSGGPSEWQDVDPGKTGFVTFTTRGKMINDYNHQTTVLDYTIVDNQKFTATRDNTTFTYWYTINGNTLELHGGGCIEQCSTRYIRVPGIFD